MEKNKMGKKGRTFWIIIPLLLIFICGFLTGSIVQNYNYEQTQMKTIAERIGINPSWVSIQDYYYCKVLKYGTHKNDVLAGIRTIGFYHSYENFGNTLAIYFDEPVIEDNLGDISIAFNKEDFLIEKSRLLGYDTEELPECK